MQSTVALAVITLLQSLQLVFLFHSPGCLFRCVVRSKRNKATTMCGVIGIHLYDVDENVASELYDGLHLLQHRGQDAAGIATCHHPTQSMYLHKDKGLIRDSLPPQRIYRMRGNCGIGHVRYTTSGSNTIDEAQPCSISSPISFALAFNGHITNVESLKKRLKHPNHSSTSNDTFIFSNYFAEVLSSMCVSSESLTRDKVFESVRKVMMYCSGGYAAVVVIQGFGLLAFRDPNGIRPLCLGTRNGDDFGTAAVAFSSESVALTGIGFSMDRDVMNGEAIISTVDGGFFKEICSSKRKFTPCIFEFVYMARPDSILDGVSVYEARAEMGRQLAKKVERLVDIKNIDVVVPVPETSRIAALHLAKALDLPYEEGLIKNRYIGRTFIMPGQDRHPGTVRRKLSPVSSVLKGRNILLIDDSIVRGTTSKELVQMVRSAGAKSVTFCSAAPPVLFPNIYGIDLPSKDHLIACNARNHDIAKSIDADMVIYQDQNCLEQSVRCFNKSLNEFECSIFDGTYVTEQYGRLVESGTVSSRYSVTSTQRDSSNVDCSSAVPELMQVDEAGKRVSFVEAVIVDCD